MDCNEDLLQKADWQTPVRETNQDEYDIYVSCAKSLGWEIKTYEEWLNS